MDDQHRIFEEPDIPVSGLAKQKDDGHLDLRPRTFDEYPGQERVCDNLKIYTKAAKMRGQMLDHCLFHGPPGLGKTTLARIIAETMECNIRETSGPIIERAADLMGVLASLEKGTVLFIDEIHRLPSNVEEILYSAMEDGKLDILVGQGPTARTVKFDLPSFTLIGATTRAGTISAPLRDRFGIVEHLEYYSDSALQKIIQRSARLLKISIVEKAAEDLSRRSRGTPRIANALLRRVLDFALVAGKESIDAEIVEASLNRLGIDDLGLGRMDREFMRIMRDRYEGGPVGLESISAALNEERSTLEDVYEPYLVHKGFLIRTARGRVLSVLAKSHLSLMQTKYGHTF
jgi:Holliday junction DNA helicase RuvB